MPDSVVEHADREQRVTLRGQLLLAAMRGQGATAPANPWLEKLLDKVMLDDAFRVQALRFVDVLPALDDDHDLVEHMREYFDGHDLRLTGLVSWGIRHSHNGGVADKLLARGIRRVMQGLARKFMGGADAMQALETVTRLRERGMAASIDLLGEATVSECEADEYLQTYLRAIADLSVAAGRWEPVEVLDNIHGRPAPRIQFSIKASALHSQCRALAPENAVRGISQRLRVILHAARTQGVSVCLDMEHYDLKGIILETFKSVLSEPEYSDWDGASIAIQAYLSDAGHDLDGLIEWARARDTQTGVRLVRGAYWDYETVVAAQNGWPCPVWDRKWKTDDCFERCMEKLFANHDIIVPAIATHNVRSLALAMELAVDYGVDVDGFELQLLYGMAPALENALSEKGYRTRIYVPFGELIPGMAYLVRRLLENSSSQSFQRLGMQEQLSDNQLLASPRGGLSLGAEAGGDESAPQGFANEPVRRFTDAAEREAFASAIESVRSRLGEAVPVLVGDRQREGADTLASHDPARPGQTVGEAVCATTEDVDDAIRVAQDAQPAWAALPVAERARCMRRAAGILRGRRDELAAWEIFESGKNWSEADADVCEAIDYLEYYADQAERLQQPWDHDCAGETNTGLYRPHGIGVVLPPWNFPLAITAGMCSAALVTGNAILLKPSSRTPVVAARFVEVLLEAGLPAGVVQLLPGRGALIGEYMVRHPAIHFIAFTGSRDVGCRIIEQAARLQPGQRHIKQVIAEMGGKNAIIIDSDADLDDAIAGVTASAFGYQGQKCSAASRVIVAGGHHDLFLDRLVEAVRSLHIGMPDDPAAFMGPVIDAGAWKRISQAVHEGKERGARAVLETDCTKLLPGHFFGPVVFADVDPGSALANEEIFGPVLSVMRAANLDEAIAMANATSYALTGGIYSRSPDRVEFAARSLEAGNLYVNRKITGAVVGRQPFGGFRLSGTGHKAGGPDYLLQFVTGRTFTENTLRRGFAPEPSVDRALARNRRGRSGD